MTRLCRLAPLLLVACSSSGDGGRPQRDEARAKGYEVWSARVDTRQRELLAKRAAAEAEDLGPVPDQAALKAPIDGWLRLRKGSLGGSEAVYGTPAKAVIDQGGEPTAAWTCDLAFSPAKGPWELYRFSLKGGKILAAAQVPAADAEGRLKELLGISY